ncbi:MULTISPECIES: EamA family transporter [Lysinibacillus]|uniref:EamA family transporter n=1 Tax=Lysinibacillus TaxID=400634 RepID=UPI0021A83285|nr:EamA family transporter [Lysinibacillus capsici]MCT1539290.1 EamA family transporter [Lysinibacillus capsici]MCT1570642.1 EamA family transporter [Lysinibacillus capsici]MCT1647450.1 EamA family transporter [Lysinibacillus capsici]MCT1726272.1 EamA family transporter [Lysinibacillus capsici]MCT1783376.1 EamA family transporter [Lysinibacillus capsici]
MGGYLYIFGTIVFTVYGQIILKWRMQLYQELPLSLGDKFFFLIKLLLDPFILSGFGSAFVASLFWMAAMTKFELSYAYPFTSLSFVLVFIISIFIFGEGISLGKVVGLLLIIAGVIVTSKSI